MIHNKGIKEEYGLNITERSSGVHYWTNIIAGIDMLLVLPNVAAIHTDLFKRCIQASERSAQKVEKTFKVA